MSAAPTFPRTVRFPRWRALLGLFWRSGGWRTPLAGALILVVGLLPTAVILATGALVEAVPGAIEQGSGGPGGRAALLALAGLAAAMGMLVVTRTTLAQLCRDLDVRYALEVHLTVATATLGTSGVAPLDDPCIADKLQAVREGERRAVMRRTASDLSTVATMRLTGLGAFVVLLGFRWWVPLLLATAWHLTNVVYFRTVERGVALDMSEGAARLRRSEYLRSLALEPAAAKEVRIFGLGGWVVDGYGRAWMGALGEMWKNRAANRHLNAAATAALVVTHAAALGALGTAAARGEVELASLFVFVQAVLATSSLGLIGDPQWSIVQSLALAEHVVFLRSRLGAQLPLGAARPQPDSDRKAVAVHLENVRFTYPRRDRPALDGLDLVVPAGQSLAIVGENGAGKSTLIKLLCGLYEPDAGRITLDDGASPRQARGRIGVIFQDFVRYALPLRENVAFGHLPSIARQEVLEGALHDAGGADLPAVLPAGWDTVLSREFEGGADLSGGQWQRVALARALTAVRGGAGLLILDEPTASLDVRAETELFGRFLDLTRDVTTVLVSHRLSSVRHADRIVVVHGGRIVEDGTHDQLMAAGGRYATMFSLQAERFADPCGSGTPHGEAGHA